LIWPLENIIHDGNQPNWKVHLVDTGLYTQTGGRLKRLRRWLSDDETFMFTYGDGVADLNIGALLEFHNSHGKLGTVTTVRSLPVLAELYLTEIKLRNSLRNLPAKAG
jgi:NDP-sugar pyrophosphorylase family protein